MRHGTTSIPMNSPGCSPIKSEIKDLSSSPVRHVETNRQSSRVFPSLSARADKALVEGKSLSMGVEPDASKEPKGVGKKMSSVDQPISDVAHGKETI